MDSATLLNAKLLPVSIRSAALNKRAGRRPAAAARRPVALCRPEIPGLAPRWRRLRPRRTRPLARPHAPCCRRALPGFARLVFVNGRPLPALSDPTVPAADAAATPLVPERTRHERFGWLNDAFATDVARLTVSGDAAAGNAFSPPWPAPRARPCIRASRSRVGEQASLTLVERHLGSVGAEGIINVAVQIHAGAGSQVRHLRWQQLADDAQFLDTTAGRAGSRRPLPARACCSWARARPAARCAPRCMARARTSRCRASASPAASTCWIIRCWSITSPRTPPARRCCVPSRATAAQDRLAQPRGGGAAAPAAAVLEQSLKGLLDGARRRDRPATAAGDPHRRGARQPRRDHRRAGREHALLPAVARPRPGHGARHAGMGLPRRRHPPHRPMPCCGAAAERGAGSHAWQRGRAGDPAMSALRRPAHRPTTWPGCAVRISRSCRSRSTAGRWPTSTMAPRRSARSAVIDAVDALRDASACQRAPRRAHAEPAGHRCLRGGARARAPLPERGVHARDHLRARHHRGHQPGGAELGTQPARPGRRDHRLGAGAPRQPRALADGWPRPPARACASCPSTTTGRSASRPSRRCSTSAPGWWRSRMFPTRWAPWCRVQRVIDAAHHARRAGAGRWRPGRGPCAGRRARAGLRFLLLLRPQAVRTHRHRRALRARSAARRHAALAGRRRHDPHRVASNAAPGTTCPTSSRPARPTSAAPSALRPPWTTWKRSASSRLPRHEHALLSAATAALMRIPGVHIHGTADDKAARAVVHARRACIRTTSAPSSTTRAWPSAPAITAPCR